MKIYLIYGGKSAEHDISILSAHSIIQNIYYEYYEVLPVYIQKDGTWLKGEWVRSEEDIPSLEEMTLVPLGNPVEEDTPMSYGKNFSFDEVQGEDAVAFPVLHGPYGEDGTIQGLFETLAIPYVGCGVLASSTGMDKSISKVLFQHAQIPQLPYIKVWRKEWDNQPDQVLDRAEATNAYPMFVKPSNLGSSVGISQADNREDLQVAIDKAFQYDRTIVIEEGAANARELEVALLGNDDIHTSVVGELVKERGFYDYESKYLDNTVRMQIPADLDSETEATIRQYAADAFLALEGSGIARADFFLTEDGEIYINEVNTLPGFTQFSMYPSLWEATGLNYKDLIEELIQLGIKRFEQRQSVALTER